MAHYAELDANDIVIRVIVIGDDHESQVGGEAGINDWCKARWGGVRWVKTSYNANSRKLFAGIGFKFNDQRNRFEQPQPFPSWTLDDNGNWVAPTPMPQGDLWSWNEDTQSWVEVIGES
jgi:hypothetical protein